MVPFPLGFPLFWRLKAARKLRKWEAGLKGQSQRSYVLLYSTHHESKCRLRQPEPQQEAPQQCQQ